MNKPIVSPVQFQGMKTEQQKTALLARMMADLINIHKAFVEKLDEVNATIDKKVGPPGEKGPKPTRQELTDIIHQHIETLRTKDIKDYIKSLIPAVHDEKLTELIKPHIPQVKDGNTPTPEELTALIKPLIPTAKDGKDAVVDYDLIIEKLQEHIPEISAETVLGALEGPKKGKKLTVDHVAGLKDELKIIKEMAQRKGHYGGGGVPSLAAGTGIQLVARNDGGYTVVATGSSSGTPVWGEALTVTTTSFTLAHTPSAGTLRLYRGGQRLQEGAGKDFTMSGAVGTLATATQTGEVFLADYTY